MKTLLTFFSLLVFTLTSCRGKMVPKPAVKNTAWSAEQKFRSAVLPGLKEKKTWFITNPSGIGREYRRLRWELMQNKVSLLGFLALEHGLFGVEEEYQKTRKSELPREALPVYRGVTLDQVEMYNLYRLSGDDLSKTLRRADAVVFDVGEVGIRCYTYLTILKRVIDALAGSEVRLIVIDHANPFAYMKSAGAMVKPGFSNMVNEMPVPMYHSLTIAELAVWYNLAYKKKVNVEPVTLDNYNRNEQADGYESWRPTSPNLPTLQSARNYQALVFLEGINVSLGRGTSGPFLYVGAPFIVPEDLLENKDLQRLPVEMTAVYFTPVDSKYKNRFCAGIKIKTARSFDPVEVGYELIRVLFELYPDKIKWYGSKPKTWLDLLWGSDSFRLAIEQKMPYSRFKDSWAGESEAWYRSVKKLLYKPGI